MPAFLQITSRIAFAQRAHSLFGYWAHRPCGQVAWSFYRPFIWLETRESIRHEMRGNLGTLSSKHQCGFALTAAAFGLSVRLRAHRCRFGPYRCSFRPYRCSFRPYRCIFRPYRCPFRPYRCRSSLYRCAFAAIGGRLPLSGRLLPDRWRLRPYRCACALIAALWPLSLRSSRYRGGIRAIGAAVPSMAASRLRLRLSPYPCGLPPIDEASALSLPRRPQCSVLPPINAPLAYQSAFAPWARLSSCRCGFAPLGAAFAVMAAAFAPMRPRACRCGFALSVRLFLYR
jgi:hypothetical protein